MNFEQMIVIMVGTIELLAGGILWKVYGERITLEKRNAEAEKTRGDHFKERADEAEKVEKANKELKTENEIIVKDKKEKDTAITLLSGTINYYKQAIDLYQWKVSKLEKDISQVRSAQFNQPIIVSEAKATSALIDALSGKTSLNTYSDKIRKMSPEELFGMKKQ